MSEDALELKSPESLQFLLAKKTGISSILQFFRFPNRELNAELAKLLWLVRLRWLAIALFSLSSVPALTLGFLSRETISIFLGMLGILFVFNLITQLFLSETKRTFGSLLIFIHLSFDIILLSSFLFLSGAFGNPFVALFLLNASLGGILIAGRLSWIFLITAHTLLGALQWQFAHLHQPLSQTLMISMFVYHLLVLVFWLVMRSLGYYLDQQHERQAISRVLHEKQDRLRALGALAAGFSHEFASPLNAAKIRLERLQREKQSEDTQEALAAVLACEDVIHQMNLSQIDSRDFQFKFVVVADLLHAIIDSWQEQHPEAKLKLHLNDQSKSKIPPINFAQVVLNLLDNAFEANPKDEITVSLSGIDRNFSLIFKDRGPGIPASILSRIGEPFVTTKQGGTGLGLYVSQLFIQSLGGEFTAKNLDQGGAYIELRWPKI